MSGKSKNPTIKERLACMEVQLETLIESMKNHLAHHAHYTNLLLGTLLVESLGILFFVLKNFIGKRT